ALTASPELKAERKKRLAFLAHPTACSCCLCSDLVLSALCLRWLLACAQGELATGNAAEGLALIRALLPRCAAVAARSAAVLRDKLRDNAGNPPALELLDELVATGYATLALQSMASPRLAEELREELETGLTFLASCRPHVPSLGVSGASLLLAKAVATVCCLASKHGNSLDGVFAGSWNWQLPAVTVAEPKVTSVPLKTDKAQPQRRKTRLAPAPAVPKTRVKKSQRAKPVVVPATDDVFALGDSDSEVTPIVIRPLTLPCTPHQTARVPAAARTRAAPGPRTPFTIFSESSPPACTPQLLRAPKVLGKVKSRLKVTFSDDSDAEDPQAWLSPAAPRKTSCARKAPSCKSGGSQASSGGCGGRSGGAQPRRARPGARRAKAAEEKKERATRRAPKERAQEERELLRAIEEEEKVEEELENSFKDMRGSEEEEGAAGRRRLPQRRQEGADREQEILRQEPSDDVPAVRWPRSGDPLRLEGTLCSALNAAGDVSSLDTVIELLKGAFGCICHCPPAALYSRICQLLALATGNRDPLATAYLLCESVSVTTRHQLLAVTHRKI
ncbi:ESPL1 protein, partial [Syrrhaptes paradoxus]|nr:ESPL1 protein [Syrrhaptes paradoxus]